MIFCCGETLEEREQNKQNEVVKAELEQSIFNLTAEEWKNIVIAYEPIWAIGTGKTATSDEAEEMLAYIRSIVAEKYGWPWLTRPPFSTVAAASPAMPRSSSPSPTSTADSSVAPR